MVGALAPVGQPAIKPIKPSCCGFAELSWYTGRLAQICLKHHWSAKHEGSRAVGLVSQGTWNCWTLWTHHPFNFDSSHPSRMIWAGESHVLDSWITFNWVFTKVEHSPLVCRRGRRCKCGWRRRGHVTCITQVLDYPHPTSPGAAWCEPPSAIAKKSAQAPLRLRLGDFFCDLDAFSIWRWLLMAVRKGDEIGKTIRRPADNKSTYRSTRFSK